MGKDIFDTDKMKKAASKISTEAKKFNTAMADIDSIIRNLHNVWDDENNTEYAKKYNNEAKDNIESLGKMLTKYGDILDEASKRYNKAIDNGESWLSVK